MRALITGKQAAKTMTICWRAVGSAFDSADSFFVSPTDAVDLFSGSSEAFSISVVIETWSFVASF